IGQEDWKNVAEFPARAINGSDGGHCSALGVNALDSTRPWAEQNIPFTIPSATTAKTWRIAQGLQCPIGKCDLFELVIIDKTNELAVRRPERGIHIPDLHQRFGGRGIQRPRPELRFPFYGGYKGQHTPIR